jgi:hypothetical protein
MADPQLNLIRSAPVSNSAFWPALIGALGAIFAASLGLVNRHKIAQVHVLVNSRLTTALDEIAALKASLRFEKTQPPETDVHRDADSTHDGS